MLKNVTLKDGNSYSAVCDPSTGRYQLECPLCGVVVKLSKTANISSMNEHLGSKRCTRLVQKRVEDRERAAAAAAITTSFPNSESGSNVRETDCESQSGSQAMSNVTAASRTSTPPPTDIFSLQEQHAISAAVETMLFGDAEIQGHDFDPFVGPEAGPSTSHTPPHILSRRPPPFHSPIGKHVQMPDRPNRQARRARREAELLDYDDRELSSGWRSPLPPSSPPASDSHHSPSRWGSSLPPSIAPSASSSAPASVPPSRSPSAASSRATSRIPSSKHFMCLGVLVKWEAGSIWDTYPFHQHATREYPWEPIHVENEMWIRLRADSCSMSTTNSTAVCEECTGIPNSLKYRRAMQRASSALDHTAWSYLTHKQLLARARLMADQLRKYKQVVGT